MNLETQPMDGPSDHIVDKVQALSDIELAALLCLITDQHCIIEADKLSVDDIDQEIRLVGGFQLTADARLIVIDCEQCFWANLRGARMLREHNVG